MHSKLLRVFAVLEVYSRCLLLFLTSEARAEEKKNFVALWCSVTYSLYFTFLSVFVSRLKRKKRRKNSLNGGLTYMYHYHVQVFFTCSPDTLRGIFFLNLICLFDFFFKQVQIFHRNLFLFVIKFLKKQKYKSMNAIHYTFYRLSVLNLPSSLQNGET